MAVERDAMDDEILARELALADSLAGWARFEGRGERRVLPSDIAAFVAGEPLPNEHAVTAVLRQDLPLRRLYEALRARRSVARQVQQVAAASDAEPHSLRLDKATLHWAEVIPGSARVLLVLQLDPELAQDGQRPVLHVQWQDECRRLRFPELVSGTAQCMLAEDDPCLQRMAADAGQTQPLAQYDLLL